MAKTKPRQRPWRYSITTVSPLSKRGSSKRLGSSSDRQNLAFKYKNVGDLLLYYIIPFVLVNTTAFILVELSNYVDGIHVSILEKNRFMRSTLDDVARDIFIILGLLVSASFIVLQMFASNFVSHAVSLFFRNRRLFIILAFVLTSAVFVLFVDIASGEWYSPKFSLTMAYIFRVLCLSITMPYFKFLVHFLNPESLIHQIKSDIVSKIENATQQLNSRNPKRSTKLHQAMLVDTLELLSDVGLSSLKANDLDNTNNTLNSLFSIAIAYLRHKPRMPSKWFSLNQDIVDRADLSTLDSFNINNLEEGQTWFEWKLLKVYQMLVEIACEKHAVQICGLAAFYIHRIAMAAVEARDHAVVELCLRFMNTFIQFTISLGDVSTTSNLLNEYRKLAIEILEFASGLKVDEGTSCQDKSSEAPSSESSQSSLDNDSVTYSSSDYPEKHVLGIMRYLLHYATVCMNAKMSYVPQVVAHDMGMICSEAYDRSSSAHEGLLSNFLLLDDRADQHGSESIVRGVRRAQVKLALFFMCNQEDGLAKEIHSDMDGDSLSRMRRVFAELTTTNSEEFWEINDRSVNLDFLSEELREELPEFFSWFSEYSYDDVVPQGRTVNSNSRVPDLPSNVKTRIKELEELLGGEGDAESNERGDAETTPGETRTDVSLAETADQTASSPDSNKRSTTRGTRSKLRKDRSIVPTADGVAANATISYESAAKSNLRSSMLRRGSKRKVTMVADSDDNKQKSRAKITQMGKSLRRNSSARSVLTTAPTLRNLNIEDESSSNVANRFRYSIGIVEGDTEIEVKKAAYLQKQIGHVQGTGHGDSIRQLDKNQLQSYCKRMTLTAMLSTGGTEASENIIDSHPAGPRRFSEIIKSTALSLSRTNLIDMEKNTKHVSTGRLSAFWKIFKPSILLAVCLAPPVAIINNIAELLRSRAPTETFLGVYEHATSMPSTYARLLLATLGQVSNLLFVLMAVTSMINLQSSANRYKLHPHLIFFLNDKVLYTILSFVALTSQFTFISMANIRPDVVPYTSMMVGSVMVSICVILVATYFLRLFKILSPGSVVERLQALAVQYLQSASVLKITLGPLLGRRDPKTIVLSTKKLEDNVNVRGKLNWWQRLKLELKRRRRRSNYQVHPTISRSPTAQMQRQNTKPVLLELQRYKWEAHEYVKRITDFALASLSHHDTGHLTVALNSLREMFIDYTWFKPDLPREWFEINSRLRVTAELVGLSDKKVEQLANMQVWFEYKLLFQYLQIFRSCLQDKQTEQCQMIAMHLSQVMELFLIQDDVYLTDVAMKFLNTMLRFAINFGDQRTAAGLVQQYRIVGSKLIQRSLSNSTPPTSTEKRELQAINIAWLLRYYLLECVNKRLYNLSDAIARQLSLLCSFSQQHDFPKDEDILEIFLSLDDTVSSTHMERALLGIRRAQTMFGISCISFGNRSQAKQIAEDICEEPVPRLKRIMFDLLAANQAEYWEVGDTGLPIPQLTPELLGGFREFFKLFPRKEGAPDISMIAEEFAEYYSRKEGNLSESVSEESVRKVSDASTSEEVPIRKKSSRRSRASSQSSRASLRGSIDSVTVAKPAKRSKPMLGGSRMSTLSLKQLVPTDSHKSRPSVILDSALRAHKRELHEGQVHLVGKEAKNRYKLFQQDVETFRQTLTRAVVVLPTLCALVTLASLNLELQLPNRRAEWEEGVLNDLNAEASGTEIWKSRKAEIAQGGIVSAELSMRYVSVVIMCTLITLQMSATRTLQHVFVLFIRERNVQFTWFVMLLVLISCQWFSMSTPNETVGFVVMALSCLSPILLYPYFAHIYFFLDSNRMVSSVVTQQLDTVENISKSVRVLRQENDSGKGDESEISHYAGRFTQQLNLLADFGDSAMHFKDTENLFQIVNALCFLTCEVIEKKGTLPSQWFQTFITVEQIAKSSDFVNLTKTSSKWIKENHCWVEWKVLRKYKDLFESSIGQIDSFCYRVAINTRLIAEAALINGDEAVLQLAIRYFNTYIRMSINSKNARVGYHVMFQYRKLVELLFLVKRGPPGTDKVYPRQKSEEMAVQCCGYLAHYATSALDSNIPFLAEVMVHDMAAVCGAAVGLRRPKHREILKLIVGVESSIHQNTEVYTGVRMVQMHLAAIYIFYKDAASTKVIKDAMEHDPADQVLEVYVNLLSTTQSEFWEFNERHYNIHYISDEIRECIEEFYLSFSHDLPKEKLRAFLTIKCAANQNQLDSSSIGDKFWKQQISNSGSLKSKGGPFKKKVSMMNMMHSSAFTWIIPCVLSFLFASGLAAIIWGLDNNVDTEMFWQSTLNKTRVDREKVFQMHSRLAAVLFTVVLTPTLIVLQINDRQLMTHIAMEYLKSPAVHGMLMLFTATNVFVITQMYLAQSIPTSLSIWLSFVLVVISATMFFPYFIYLFNFVSPAVVVEKVMTKCMKRIQEVEHNPKRIERVQLFLVQSVAKLSEYGRTSIHNLDRTKASHVIVALSNFLEEYCNYKCKRLVSNAWFEFSKNDSIASSSEFMNSQPQYLDDLAKNRIFAEWLVIRQFHNLFGVAVGKGTLTDVGQLIAIHTYHAGKRFHLVQDYHGVMVVMTAFNSYMRIGLNSRNLLVLFNLLHQYRRLAETCILNTVQLGTTVDQSGGADKKNASLHENTEFTCRLVVQVAMYIRLYAEEALKQNLGFAAGVAAMDLQQLCGLLSNLLYLATTGQQPLEPSNQEGAEASESPLPATFPKSLKQSYLHTMLNDVQMELQILVRTFLNPDELGPSTIHLARDMSMKAVLKLLVQYEAQLVVDGHEERIQLWTDIEIIWKEPEHLQTIQAQLSAVESPHYWEINDRGMNFEYIPFAFREKFSKLFERVKIDMAVEETILSSKNQLDFGIQSIDTVDEQETRLSFKASNRFCNSRSRRYSTREHDEESKASDEGDDDENDVSNVELDNGTRVWTNSVIFLPLILGFCLIVSISADVLSADVPSFPFGAMRSKSFWLDMVICDQASENGTAPSTNCNLNMEIDQTYMLATQRSMTVMLYTFLGFVITVSIVVIQIASNRFTSVVVSLFIRNRQFATLLICFVGTAVYATFVSTVSSPVFLSPYCFLVLVALAFGNFFTLFPFVSMLFSFLDSNKVFLFIAKGGIDAFPSKKNPITRNRADTQHRQLSVCKALDQVTDFGLKALHQKDKHNTYRAIQLIVDIGINHIRRTTETEIASDWFKIGYELRNGLHFVTLTPDAVNFIEQNGTWASWIVLKQLQKLFNESLGFFHDGCTRIGVNTRRLLEAAVTDGDLKTAVLVSKFFNTFMRTAINKRDLRAADHVSRQYRLCCAFVFSLPDQNGSHSIAMDWVGYLQSYLVASGVSDARGVTAIIISHDIAALLAFLARRVQQGNSALAPVHDTLLRNFLGLLSTSESGSATVPENCRPGVFRAILKLAANYIICGPSQQTSLSKIAKLLELESRARIEALWEVFEQNRFHESFWEVADRGSNLDYLTTPERAALQEFLSALTTNGSKRGRMKSSVIISNIERLKSLRNAKFANRSSKSIRSRIGMKLN